MLATLALGLSSLAFSRAQAGEGHSTVASGAHFRVTVHFDDKRIADEAVLAAEAAWPFATEIFGAIQVSAESPLEIHIYRNSADYERAEAALTHGKFKANLSFTCDATRDAHIALQPDATEAVLARVGLPLLTRQLVAHEAAHVACSHAWPNFATLPSWFAEGAATWISERAMVKGGWISSPSDDPFLSTQAVRVKQLEANKKLPSLGAIFDDLLGDIEFHQRYAVWKHAFQFLHDGKHAAALANIFAAVRQTGGGPDHAAAVAKAARSALGSESALKAYDTEFAKYVRGLKARWEESFRSLSTSGDAWITSAFPEKNAIAWRTDDVASERYQLSGELEIVAGDTHQVNVLLGRTEYGFVQVAFTAEYGIDVFEYDRRRLDDEVWKKLASREIATLQTGRSIPFVVRVAKSKLAVEVDGNLLCEVDVGDHPMKGAFGLGARASSTGIWRKIQLKQN